MKNNNIDAKLENNKICVFEIAFVEPPYTSDTCSCKNLKVLNSVKKLVEEFSTWNFVLVLTNLA